MDSEVHEKRQSPLRVGFRLVRNGVLFVAIIVGLIFVAVVVVQVIHNKTSSGTSSADRVATEAGASSCDNSGYYLESQLTGKKQTIYDCTMPSGAIKCVTENGGIASDDTVEVRLVFQNTLGSSKPSCLG